MKQLVINPKLCINCKVCEQACAMEHEEEPSMELPRIRIIAAKEEGGIHVPETCLQCIDAPCMKVCPTGAICVSEDLGAVLINYWECIGCLSCVAGCPFGNMLHDVDRPGYVFKCDLCMGDPACARFCPTGAITYVEIEPLAGKQQMVLDEEEVAS